MADVVAVEVPTPPSIINEKLSLALRLLGGTRGNFITAYAGFGTALSAVLYVFIAGDMTVGERRFFMVSQLYSISAAFTLAKTVRDRQQSGMPFIPFIAENTVRGSRVWFVQVVVSFVVAVCFSLYFLWSGHVDGDYGLALMGAAYMITATLNLAKTTRDGFDAIAFQRAVNSDMLENEKLLRCVVEVAEGTRGHALTAGVGLLLSVVVVQTGAWMLPGLNAFHRAFVSLGVLFVAASTANAAKLVRDQDDLVLRERLTRTYIWSTWFFFVVSISGTVAGIASMPASGAVLRILILGCAFLLSTILTLSKVARDKGDAWRGGI